MATEAQTGDDPEAETGVEKEEDDDGQEARARPYDATKIRISTKTWSLRQLVDDIAENVIDLVPDFQRAYVWKAKQQSRLIESILLGVPLPSFYFSADENNTMQVVDGVQRLTTILGFYNNNFSLDGLEYLNELHTQRFSDLAPVWQRRVRQAQFLVHVIEPQTPTELKFDIFRRLNTGGTPLTSQQIRHCISKPRSRELLRRMTSSEAFDRATRGAYTSDPNMTARELALRFIALRDFDRAAYARAETLDDFLINVTKRLDDPKATSDDDLAALAATFESAMSRAWAAFGKSAFRRSASSQINRALFDSWAVALAEVDEETFVRRRDDIAKEARHAMDTDAVYERSFSVATGYGGRMEYRLKMARAIVRGGDQ